jgi:hypothetical protein
MTHFTASAPKSATAISSRFLATGARFLALPFDTVRRQYAAAAGKAIDECSLLASTPTEQTLATLERFVLGPVVRHG